MKTMLLRHRENIQGSALLEMVLFTPLALFFLIVVIDGGFAYLQRASITDAVRASLNTEFLHEQGKGVLQLDAANFTSSVDNLAATTLATAFAGEIADKVGAIQHSGSGDTPTSFKVTVASAVVDIDESSGAIADTHFELLPVVEAGNTGFDISQFTPGFQPISMHDFIAAEISRQASKDRSSFAIPIGVHYSGNTEPGKIRYFNKAVLVYAEVIGYTRTFNSEATKRLLGSLYAVNVQHLVLLRTQLS